jgi:type I restriction enzyme S subunit
VSWAQGKVSNIADVISGYAFKSKWFGNGTAKVVRIGDLKNGRVELTKAETFDDKANLVRDHFKIRAGDILMALSGATVGKIAVADEETDGAYLNQRVAVIRGKHPENTDYLKYVFSGEPLKRLLLNAGGAAQPNLSPKDLSDMEIPLPYPDDPEKSLKEQQRIAAILDKADGIRRKRQQAIELADEFLRSVFLDMFGDPVTNPKGWEFKSLANGIDSISSGWSAKGESYPCKAGHFGVLKISSVTSGKFKPSENKHVHSQDIPEGKGLIFPKKGDLLFSRANTRELVAATCIVFDDQDDKFLPDKLWKIKTNDNNLLPEFLNYLIWQPQFKEKLTSQATGTSGSMLNISKSKFESTEAIFPPLEFQKEFKLIYWKTQALLNKLCESLAVCETSFGSLSQKAFKGEL